MASPSRHLTHGDGEADRAEGVANGRDGTNGGHPCEGVQVGHLAQHDLATPEDDCTLVELEALGAIRVGNLLHHQRPGDAVPQRRHGQENVLDDRQRKCIAGAQDGHHRTCAPRGGQQQERGGRPLLLCWGVQRVGWVAWGREAFRQHRNRRDTPGMAAVRGNLTLRQGQHWQRTARVTYLRGKGERTQAPLTHVSSRWVVQAPNPLPLRPPQLTTKVHLANAIHQRHLRQKRRRQFGTSHERKQTEYAGNPPHCGNGMGKCKNSSACRAVGGGSQGGPSPPLPTVASGWSPRISHPNRATQR